MRWSSQLINKTSRKKMHDYDLERERYSERKRTVREQEICWDSHIVRYLEQTSRPALSPLTAPGKPEDQIRGGIGPREWSESGFPIREDESDKHLGNSYGSLVPELVDGKFRNRCLCNRLSRPIVQRFMAVRLS